jgi:hypothetical protein
MVFLKLATLTGKLAFLETQECATKADATKIVEDYASANGFTNVKLIDDGDPCSFRYTARTPAGRNGRNIAFLDYE